MKDRESEVREVLETYEGMERECAAAKQSVCGDVRARALRLRELWAQLGAAASEPCEPSVPSDASAASSSSGECRWRARVTCAPCRDDTCLITSLPYYFLLFHGCSDILGTDLGLAILRSLLFNSISATIAVSAVIPTFGLHVTG